MTALVPADSPVAVERPDHAERLAVALRDAREHAIQMATFAAEKAARAAKGNRQFAIGLIVVFGVALAILVIVKLAG